MKKRILLTVLFAFIIIAFFILFDPWFLEPCGYSTTAAVPTVQYKCDGLMYVPFMYSGAGGRAFFCLGSCDLTDREPKFYCDKSEDCISGCGWKAGDGGCIVVSKNSKDYLEKNNLKTEERFPILCHNNICAFDINGEAVSFTDRDGKIYPYYVSYAEEEPELFLINPGSFTTSWSITHID